MGNRRFEVMIASVAVVLMGFALVGAFQIDSLRRASAEAAVVTPTAGGGVAAPATPSSLVVTTGVVSANSTPSVRPTSPPEAATALTHPPGLLPSVVFKQQDAVPPSSSPGQTSLRQPASSPSVRVADPTTPSSPPAATTTSRPPSSSPAATTAARPPSSSTAPRTSGPAAGNSNPLPTKTVPPATSSSTSRPATTPGSPTTSAAAPATTGTSSASGGTRQWCLAAGYCVTIGADGKVLLGEGTKWSGRQSVALSQGYGGQLLSAVNCRTADCVVVGYSMGVHGIAVAHSGGRWTWASVPQSYLEPLSCAGKGFCKKVGIAG
jgi:hypothetical protein